ncbi:MAG: hypothetical protein WCD89_27235 [Anaerocolumna sp.]
MTDIQVRPENSFLTYEGIMLYNKDKTVLLSYPSADGEVALPEGKNIRIYNRNS